LVAYTEGGTRLKVFENRVLRIFGAKAEKCLTSCKPVSFSRRTLLHGASK
jgi:hypothetical protein